MLRRPWAAPLFVIALFLAILVRLDDQQRAEVEAARREAAAEAERRATALGVEIENTVNSRLAALEAAKSWLAEGVDSASERAFLAAADSATRDISGLSAISLVRRDSTLQRGSGSYLGSPGLDVRTDTVVSGPYARAIASMSPSSSSVLDLPVGRRFFVFDPVASADGAEVRAVVVGELDPGAILRASVMARERGGEEGSSGLYTLIAPPRTTITTIPLPRGWPTRDFPIAVADIEWTLRFAYAPLDERGISAARLAMWIAGIVLGLALAGFLVGLQRSLARQREEIVRREAAERDARALATELARRATELQRAESIARGREKEARELATQLSSAHTAAEHLSTSLDPEEVVEYFLGTVGELIDADVASLYTFEEEGEVLVGRKRILLREDSPIAERLSSEDIRQVRAPVTMLPGVGEAVATGEPHIISESHPQSALLSAGGSEVPASSLTLPILFRGSVVGVASWDSYGWPQAYERGAIAFAEALAATAAAALHTAELFSSLELARADATREALRFAALLDQMADGVVVVDASGRVERTNKAAEEMLGPRVAEASVDEWPTAFAVQSIDGRPCTPDELPLARALRGERARRMDFVARSARGDQRQYSGSAAPIITPSGSAAGAALVFRDVSDEREYAEMLRHTNRQLREQAEVLERVNHELREATLAKDRFLAMMSHELRTPINAVIGYTDLLDLEVKGTLNADQKAMLTRIRETTNHLLGLINQVLDLAKVGSGQLDVMLAEVSLPAVIEKCVPQVVPLAAAKGLRLRVLDEGFASVPPVLADETRVTQILLNLLSNAVKFTDEGSVEVGVRVREVFAELWVRDTGPGIPADKHDVIFEEFYQIDSDLTRAAGGTGLGLPIARRLAKLMKGDVVFWSEPGAGSEFTVRLPLARKPPKVAAPPGVSATAAVLWSRDREPVPRQLRNGRLRILTTGDPLRLIGIARRESPDLVGLDLATANDGAVRALVGLHATGAEEPLQVVLLSPTDGPRSSGVDLGSFWTMPRPLSVEKAVNAVRRVAGALSGAPVVLANRDPDVRRILGEALGGAGYSVRTVEDGREAIEAARENPPAIVILNLVMAGTDAITAVAEMRGDPVLETVPVLVLIPGELSREDLDLLRRAVSRLADCRREGEIALPELIRFRAEAGFSIPGTST